MAIPHFGRRFAYERRPKERPPFARRVSSQDINMCNHTSKSRLPKAWACVAPNRFSVSPLGKG
jgi:hypothetical protein